MSCSPPLLPPLGEMAGERAGDEGDSHFLQENYYLTGGGGNGGKEETSASLFGLCFRTLGVGKTLSSNGLVKNSKFLQ